MKSALPTTTEPTGQDRPFERQKVALSAPARSSVAGVRRATAAFHRRAPSTWSGTPISWATAADSRGVGGGQRLAHRWRVRVLEHHQGGRRLVASVGIAASGADVVEGHLAVGAGRDLAHGGAADDRVAAGLVLDDVRSPRGHDLAAASHVGHVRDEVAHRAAGHEERRPPCRSARRHAPARAMTVGSSPKTSSPTSASAMARRIAGVGLVTVSERRSMKSGMVSRA